MAAPAHCICHAHSVKGGEMPFVGGASGMLIVVPHLTWTDCAQQTFGSSEWQPGLGDTRHDSVGVNDRNHNHHHHHYHVVVRA